MAEFPKRNFDNIFSLALLLDIWKDYCILRLCLVLLLITAWSLVGGKSLNSWKTSLECSLKWKCWNSHEFLLLILWLLVLPKIISCHGCQSAPAPALPSLSPQHLHSIGNQQPYISSGLIVAVVGFCLCTWLPGFCYGFFFFLTPTVWPDCAVTPRGTWLPFETWQPDSLPLCLPVW